MEKLIRRCQQGDREALGELYTTMHDELLAHCRKYEANDDTANDLLHDAFLLIFSNIEKLRSPEKGRQWMHKVVKNVCLLYVQQRQNRPLIPVDETKEAAQVTEPPYLSPTTNCRKPSTICPTATVRSSGFRCSTD